MANVYDFTVKDLDGNDVKLDRFKGKVLLIVNTATAWGFTPQLGELQDLYQKYVEQGFEILHFPCNQFGRQAKGSNKEIKKFCSSNFGTTFSQFGKIDVNGENADPLYTWLKSQKGFAGFDLNNQIGAALDAKFRSEDPNYADNPDIKWNFTKFLLGRNGEVQERFESTAAAGEMAPKIEALL